MLDRSDMIAIGVSIGSLLAQASETIPNVPGVISSMTSTGVLIWYLWYSTTRVIPGLTERFNAELKEVREANMELNNRYNTQLSQLRELFIAEQRAMREQHEKQLQALRDLCPKPQIRPSPP